MTGGGLTRLRWNSGGRKSQLRDGLPALGINDDDAGKAATLVQDDQVTSVERDLLGMRPGWQPDLPESGRVALA